jgi:threonine/homoserine/homoserine lactone efflux protein
VIARVLLLIVAGVAFFLVAGLPARHLGGDQAMIQCGAALLLALVPGVLTMLWAGSSLEQNPAQASLLLLGAGGLRMFAVLGVAVLLYFQGPWFREQDGFLFWVLGAYLYLLAVEIMLIVRGPRTQDTRTAGS